MVWSRCIYCLRTVLLQPLAWKMTSTWDVLSWVKMFSASRAHNFKPCTHASCNSKPIDESYEEFKNPNVAFLAFCRPEFRRQYRKGLWVHALSSHLCHKVFCCGSFAASYDDKRAFKGRLSTCMSLTAITYMLCGKKRAILRFFSTKILIGAVNWHEGHTHTHRYAVNEKIFRSWY